MKTILNSYTIYYFTRAVTTTLIKVKLFIGNTLPVISTKR